MKNQKGITLIALIITIIVMLILAVITINIIIGEDGIIKRAQDSKYVNEQVQEFEKIKLATSSASITGEGNIIKDNLTPELINKFGNENGNWEYFSNCDQYSIVKIYESGNYYLIKTDGELKTISPEFADSSIFEYIINDDDTVNITKVKEISGDVLFIPNKITCGDGKTRNVYGIGSNDTGKKIFDETMDIVTEDIGGGLEAIVSDGIEIIIENGIKVICEGAMYRSNIEKITIPDSITTIGANAFLGCRNLKEVNGLNNVTTIGENSFSNCFNLSEIHLSSNINSIGTHAFQNAMISYKIKVYINKSAEEIKNMSEFSWGTSEIFDKNENKVEK